MLSRIPWCFSATLALAALLASSPALCGAATYVGAAVCARCHANEFAAWRSARHSKMIQPASPASIRGDFKQGRITLRGEPYILRVQGNAYYITESYLTGKPVEHRVDYTLGSRRIQHYLTTLPDGRIVVLPPSWDVRREQWFHNFDIGDQDESGEVEAQVWNKQCFSCHVSQQQKGFDLATRHYNNSWLDFGTNCERCHGPGSEHVAHYSAKPVPRAPAGDIVLQTRLAPDRNTMVCAQCHSFRDIFVPGFAAGDNYYDHFLPILEYDQPVDKDASYWPDGRTRRFSNDAIGLWQSQCFLKGGAVCVTCHMDAHTINIDKNLQLRSDNNALCTRCHQAIGRAVAAHTHHPATSVGSSCVECHMPRSVLSVKAEIRDHSMSVPVPENTLRHGIPNACNGCHKDKDASWSLENMNRWYRADSRRQSIRRADAFALAREGSAESVPALIEIASDPSENPLARANAAGYLSRFANAPGAFRALERAFQDPHPMVRAVAALRITAAPQDRPAAIASLTRSLGDSAATVRLAAAVSLVGMGVKKLPGEDGARFEQAKALYEARAALNGDDAQQQFAVGRFYLLLGDGAKAAAALANSMKLDPRTLAQYYLAYAYAEQEKYDEARSVLQSIAPADPQFARAQELLRAIAGRSSQR